MSDATEQMHRFFSRRENQNASVTMSEFPECLKNALVDGDYVSDGDTLDQQYGSNTMSKFPEFLASASIADTPDQHFSITRSKFPEFLESEYIDFEYASNGDTPEDTQRSERCSRGFDGCGILRTKEASFVVKGSLLSRRLLQGHHDTSDSDESHDFDHFQGKNKKHEGTPPESEEQF